MELLTSLWIASALLAVGLVMAFNQTNRLIYLGLAFLAVVANVALVGMGA